MDDFPLLSSPLLLYHKHKRLYPNLYKQWVKNQFPLIINYFFWINLKAYTYSSNLAKKEHQRTSWG